MTNTYPVLDFNDIQNIKIFVFDTIQNESNTPFKHQEGFFNTIFVLKRFLDLRESYKRERLEQDSEFSLDSEALSSDELLKRKQHPYIHVDGKESWYDIEWEDILAYKTNNPEGVCEFKLGNKDDPFYARRAIIETDAKNSIDLFFQIPLSFSSKATDNVFQSIAQEDIVRENLSDEIILNILIELGKYKFDLHHAPEISFGAVFSLTKQKEA